MVGCDATITFVTNALVLLMMMKLLLALFVWPRKMLLRIAICIKFWCRWVLHSVEHLTHIDRWIWIRNEAGAVQMIHADDLMKCRKCHLRQYCHRSNCRSSSSSNNASVFFDNVINAYETCPKLINWSIWTFVGVFQHIFFVEQQCFMSSHQIIGSI